MIHPSFLFSVYSLTKTNIPTSKYFIFFLLFLNDFIISFYYILKDLDQAPANDAENLANSCQLNLRNKDINVALTFSDNLQFM